MRQLYLSLVAVAALAAAALAPVRAELLPEQNGIDVRALLAPHGFTDIEILRRHIDRVDAEACRDGGRWRVSLALLSGRATASERLGECAATIAVMPNDDVPVATGRTAPPLAPIVVRAPAEPEGPWTLPSNATAASAGPAEAEPAHRGVLPPWSDEDRAMRALERIGYTGARLRKWGREGWRGTACRDGKLREVRLSADLRPAAPIRAMRECPPGRERPRDLTVGPPEPPIRSVRDVKARLMAKGYSGVGRIEIEGGAFHAEACERGWRFRVTVAPDGAVRGRRNLGRCAGADVARLPASSPVPE